MQRQNIVCNFISFTLFHNDLTTQLKKPDSNNSQMFTSQKASGVTLDK